MIEYEWKGARIMNVVYSNLRVIMAERAVTIKDINQETSLSRTTISNLIHNNANGVQFDTLRQLCKFLNCEVGDIIKNSELIVEKFMLEKSDLGIPTQNHEKTEWYKEQDFKLEVHLNNNERNLMTAGMVKVQEGFHDKEKNNIILGVFFEDRLQKSISRNFGNSVITEGFLEEIMRNILDEIGKYGFEQDNAVVTYSPIMFNK